MLYCTVFTTLGALASFYLLDFNLLFNLPLNLPLYAAIAILEAAFAVYAALYLICQRFYEMRIRNSLVPKK